MCAAPAAVAIRAVPEVVLVDRLQQQDDGALRHLVFKRRYAKATLAAIRLVDVMTANWRRPVATRFEPVDQSGQILL